MHDQGGAWSLVCGLWVPGDPQFQSSLPVACGALSRVTDQLPSYSWELDMENEYKYEEPTEGRPDFKLLKMNGARSKRFRYFLRKGFPTEEAFEKSKYPINRRANERINSTSNKPSRSPHHQEKLNSSDKPSPVVCKLSYRELKNMSSLLPNAKLKSRFYYQTRVLGIDPDQSLKALLAEPSTVERLDDDELVGYGRGRSLLNQTARPSTSRQRNTPSCHQSPPNASRSTNENRSFTEQCERIRNNDSSRFGTGSLGLPGIASSSRLTRDGDRLSFNTEESHYGGDRPSRHDKSYSGSEQDFRDSHTGYPSKFSIASTSQTAWNEENFPQAQIDMEESSDDDRYESSRRDRSRFGSELGSEDFRDLCDPPRWDRAHPDSGLDQSNFRGSPDPQRYVRSHAGSKQDQKDLVDIYDPPRWERSHPDLKRDQVDLRELLRRNRSYTGSAEGGKNFPDKYDPPRRGSSRPDSEFDREDEHGVPNRPQLRSRRGSLAEQKGSRDRSHRVSKDNRKYSLDKICDRPRRDGSHRRSEPDRRDSRDSPREPREPRPLEDPQRCNVLKEEYERFLCNLKWSPPPQTTTATETTDDQPAISTRKRKLSTQVAQPSLVMNGDPVPLARSSILPGLPIKRPALDQGAINSGISSLMDPLRWISPNEGTPEEVEAWKDDYQRFLQAESWKKDYRRVLGNINKTGTTSSVSHDQTSGNSPGQSKKVHQPEPEPSTRKRIGRDESAQPKTESTQAPRKPPRSQQGKGRRRPPKSQRDKMRPELFKRPITAGTQSTEQLDNHTRKNIKGLGSNQHLPHGSSSGMALPNRSSAEETKDPSGPIFIVPSNFPNERLSAEQMDAVESNILEAILEINNESIKPSFSESFRRNGKYGVICNDQFSNDWLHKHIQMNEPWPNASLQIVTANRVRVSVKLPLCKNDDNDRILKFIIKQNANLDAKDWTVFHRLDSDTYTSAMFLVDEDSVGDIRNCGKINFKMGCVNVVVEGDSEVKPGPSSAVPSSSASHGGSAPSNSTERVNPMNTGRGSLGPQGMPLPINHNLPNMLDSSFGLAETNMEFSSPRGSSGLSDPLRLPLVQNPLIQHSRLPVLPSPRDGPTLLNPCGDTPLYFGNPNQSYFGEQSGLFTPKPDQPYPNPYRELGYLEASLKSNPFPRHESPPPPLLGDALVTRSRVPHGRAERPLPETSSRGRHLSRSPSDRDYLDRPHRVSRPDRIPTSGGIIRRDRALLSHQQRSSRSPPPSRSHYYRTSHH